MQYPLISEYVEAIRSAEDNFDKLSNLRPVLDGNGNPVMSCGNFAVVFKMKDVITGRFFAVKCFIKDQERRSEHYKLIAEELNYVSSPYLLHVRYLERELFVNTAGSDEEEFPVLVMDWVKGKPLDVYLKRHINDTYELQMLAYRFCKLGAWLLSQPFAHGDLKPDNILVREDGTLVLVDYDGMYVPAMEGSEAIELGSPDFRHPLRDKKVFNEHNDDFSVASIALSLKSIALDSQLYHKYAAADRLLFSAADYRDIGQSSALQAIVGLSSDAELSLLLGIFLLAWSKNSLESISFRLLLLTEPKKPVIEVLSTEITDEERKNAIKDEFGATYTADGLKLISGPWSMRSSYYAIKEGTRVIGNWAFEESEPHFSDRLQSITIPDSVTSIGEGAFSKCDFLQSITIPHGVKNIGKSAFSECSSLESIIIPNSVTSIGDCAFQFCNSLESITIPDSVTSIGEWAFCHCQSLESITIPDSVTSIGEGAFCDCESLESIIIPNSVISIGNMAFQYCKSLVTIIIPNSVKSIGKRAFEDCRSLESITIPGSVTSIGDYAFQECNSLESIIIPNSVTSIGDCAFQFCNSLESIIIPNSVTSIGEGAFQDCNSLESITIPNSVTSIGDYAFKDCNSLESITIPQDVKNIGGGIFNGCYCLNKCNIKSCLFRVYNEFLYTKTGKVISCWSKSRSIVLPNTTTSIGDKAFSDCSSLQSITIPDSVKNIGNEAFCGCSSLQSITIPDSVKNIGNEAFYGCSSLQSITIPDSVTSIGDGAFRMCPLHFVTIPESVTSIGFYAFEDCCLQVCDDYGLCYSHLEKMYIPKGKKDFILKALGNSFERMIVEI